MQRTAPSGWPAEVRPPGAPDWERTAAGWLLDQCPPEYRQYPGLQGHLVVLARFAALHVAGGQEAARQGLATVRADLQHVVDPDVVERAVRTLQLDQARLEQRRRAVALLEEALRAHYGTVPG